MVTEAHPVYIRMEALERADSEELRAAAADTVFGKPRIHPPVVRKGLKGDYR
jgi:hypothetical protein